MIQRRAIIVIVVCTSCAVSVSRAPADTWTNAAGDTIEATPSEFDGRTVVFQRPTGEEIRIPLFSLAGSEQQRVKEYFNGPQIPGALQQAYAFATDQLDRARLLFTEGQMDDAAYAARRENVIGSFKRSCSELSYAEDSEEVQQLVARLLAR